MVNIPPIIANAVQGDGGNSPASSTAAPDPARAQNRNNLVQIQLPNNLVALRVPKGGSMCANCAYLKKDGQSCGSTDFIKWEGPNKSAGSDRIPSPADEYCSVWWKPKQPITPAPPAPPDSTPQPTPFLPQRNPPQRNLVVGGLSHRKLPLRSPGSI